MMILSRMVYQTYNGYVLSQFKKVQSDLRNQGRPLAVLRGRSTGKRKHEEGYPWVSFGTI
jgi:hypothetical protein